MALIRFSICFLIPWLFFTGCASSPELDIVLGKSPRGAVYLERIPDRTFQAAHPIKIGSTTVARVLTGVTVKEDQGLLRSLMAGQPSEMPAFTEEEVRYLTPLIVDGLARAADDQQVGFRLIQSGSASNHWAGAGVGSSEPPRPLAVLETTRGSVYAYGRSLYITLTEYRVRTERADTIYMANRRVPDPTGLMNRSLFFTPESAQRPASYRGKNSTDSTLVIDYELLATLPQVTPTASTPGRPPQPSSPAAQTPPVNGATEGQLRELQEQMRQKNQELEEVRKELRDIRRQLPEPSRK